MRYGIVIPLAALAILLSGCGITNTCQSVSCPENSPVNKISRSFDMSGCVALTNTELARLRAAWESTGPEHDVIAERLQDVDEYIAAGLNIPPEGGQHNQWYQCEKCQMHLETIDPTHHKCPTCGHVYSGWPYDNVLYNHIHHSNSYYIRHAADAYAITGDEKYSRFATDLLLGYAELYTTLPRIVNWSKDRPVYEKDGVTPTTRGGYISNQTLNESMIMVEVAAGLDILRHTHAISDEDVRKINSGFIRPMADSICGNRMQKSNWQTWHNAAFVYASAVLEDETLLDRAISDPHNGFYRQMDISVLDDGMWYETSWGYHYYTLRAMTDIAEGMRRLGRDIYKTPELKSMYMAVLDYILPDGSLPMFGDAVSGESYNFDMGNEPAYSIYKDAALGSLLSKEPNWYSILHGRDTSEVINRPAATSAIKQHAGHAILRSSTADTDSAAILVFGPYGGFHGHFDKLSFVYVTGDDTVAIDHGRAKSQAYRLPIHRQWYKSTISHNTVMVDSEDQQGIEGKCLQSHLGSPDGYSAATATADGLFGDKATMTRFILTYKDSLIVIDQLKSLDGQPHRFDWLLHSGAATATTRLAAAENPLGLPDHPGCGYLKNVKYYDLAGGMADISFGDGSSALATANIAIAGADKANLTCADGPFASVTERAAAAILTATGTDIVIASIISSNSNACPAPQILQAEGKLGVKVGFSNNESCEIIFKNANIADGFTVSGIK